MMKSKTKLEGVIVKFERSIFLSAEDHDLSELDRETIVELAVNKWNEEMGIDLISMSDDDITEIEVEMNNSKGQTVLVNLSELED